ncbi:MAG: hypothetical protein J5709_01020 [Bacteroidales bacterium]|nr:hypothetical protein [Bacteroidales bacterium]
MKTYLSLLSVLFIMVSCQKDDTVVPRNQGTSSIVMTVGEKDFAIVLAENATANAFAEMLPITITMSELNGNEKYAYLENELPTDASCPQTIECGDVMLYGNNCIVVFYKTFKTSYSYTRIGKIKDVQQLQESLGTGNIIVKYCKS